MKLILMPGLDGTGALFKPLLSALGPQIPTHILSYPSDKYLTYAETSEYARGQLQTIDDQLVLVAESYSGPVALQLLQNPLPNIKGTIFSATFCERPQSFLASLARLLPLEHLLKITVPDSLIKLFCLGPNVSPETVALLKDTLAKSDPRILAKRLHEICSLKPPKLTVREIPSCYIQAQHDRLVPNSCFKSFQKLVPHIQLIKVNGPHFLLQAKPYECKEIIERFMINIMINADSDFK